MPDVPAPLLHFALMLIFLPGVGGAQSSRALFADEQTRRPVVGAVGTRRDPLDRPIAIGMTDLKGQVMLTTVHAGDHSLGRAALGYVSHVMRRFALDSGSTLGYTHVARAASSALLNGVAESKESTLPPRRARWPGHAVANDKWHRRREGKRCTRRWGVCSRI